MTERKANLEGLEEAIDGLLGALESEREKNKELRRRVGELELELSRAPKEVERLGEENRRLKRNMRIAADKITEVLERI